MNPIKTKSSNPKDIYDRLLDKSVLRAQCHQLAKRFDFTKTSWIAERASVVFNTSMSQHEAISSIKRLEPGEMLAVFNDRRVILPVAPITLIESLKSGKPFEQAIWEHEFQLVDIANTVDPSVTIRDIHILLNPRALLPLTRQTPCTNPPVFNGISIKDMDIKRKAVSHTLVPSHIRKTMEDTLVCEGISKERAYAITDLLAKFRESFYPKVEELKPGQLSWNAISAIDNFQETHSNKYREQIPVILTIYTPDEIHAIKSNIHNLTLNFINDILQQQIARVTSEAYLQGGLLSQLDLQMFFYRSYGIISKQIVEYEEKHKVILPTPGTIKDAGRRFTHKRIVISLYLEGYLSKDIAVKTHHSGIAVDRYIDGFLRVMALHLYSVPPEVMSRTLKFSVNLVNEYISIVKEHFPNPDKPEPKRFVRSQNSGVRSQNKRVA